MSRAQQHPPLPDDVAARWSKFGRGDDELYVNLLGLVVEEIRTDYCRTRMPFRPVLNQAAGIVHGGAVSALIDTAMGAAVAPMLPEGQRCATIEMQVRFLRTAGTGTLRAEASVIKPGSTVFHVGCTVTDGANRTVATGTATFAVIR